MDANIISKHIVFQFIFYLLIQTVKISILKASCKTRPPINSSIKG